MIIERNTIYLEKEFPYLVKVRPMNSSLHLEIKEWLDENFGPYPSSNEHRRCVYVYFGKWSFKFENDAILFAMRWG